MRIAILFIAALLAGCNSSDDDSALQQQTVPNEATAVQALRARVDSLQSKLDSLQLIGKTHGFVSMDSGEAITANFGPCADMGVLVGFVSASNSFISDPLYAKYQAFKQCTGFSYETDVSTGQLAPASRLYWDAPNCTGNEWEWPASGSSFNNQSLENGVVFLNPADMTTQLMVSPGQIPTMVQAASVYIVSNGDCETDGDFQPMYKVTENNTQITGVPGGVGNYNLASP